MRILKIREISQLSVVQPCGCLSRRDDLSDRKCPYRTAQYASDYFHNRKINENLRILNSG